MAEHFMKLENNNKSIIDLNMDLNELFRDIWRTNNRHQFIIGRNYGTFLKTNNYHQVVIGTAQCQNDTFIQAHA